MRIYKISKNRQLIIGRLYDSSLDSDPSIFVEADVVRSSQLPAQSRLVYTNID